MAINKPEIGKNVIETLTLGMYEDPRFVFREYIQNSADQIDVAVEERILEKKSEGHIYITIDAAESKIVIEDNATGIISAKVLDLLGNIAQSRKDSALRKGFRGIGRLGGLGYCDVLTFETSAKGEAIKSTMVWDAKELKNIINNKAINIDAATLISAITSNTIAQENTDVHYFRVIMERITNKELLDVENVKEYLSMVAPLPYDSVFLFKDKIKQEFIKYGYNLDEYNVYVNTDKLYKAYRTDLLGATGEKIGEVLDVDFFTLKDSQHVLLAVGWHGVMNTLNKKLTQNNIFRGFRLRKGNIQIGSDDTLNKFFKEERFNQYFIGEIFVIDSRMIPNARRDYFVDNETCQQFQRELKEKLNGISKLTRFTSDIVSNEKKIQDFEEVKEQYRKIIKRGVTDEAQRQRLQKELESAKQRAEEARKKLNRWEKLTHEDTNLHKIFTNVVQDRIASVSEQAEDVSKEIVKFRADSLSRLSVKEKELVTRIFSVIDRILTPDMAEELKCKIEEELK